MPACLPEELGLTRRSSDVTPRVDPQLSRAASLVLSSLSFIHDLRSGQLQPDAIRGTSLDMSQYERLFGTCRVPTDVSDLLCGPESMLIYR